MQIPSANFSTVNILCKLHTIYYVHPCFVFDIFFQPITRIPKVKAHFLLNPNVTEFWKSVNIWQSYEQIISWVFFYTQCTTSVCAKKVQKEVALSICEWKCCDKMEHFSRQSPLSSSPSTYSVVTSHQDQPSWTSLPHHDDGGRRDQTRTWSWQWGVLVR